MMLRLNKARIFTKNCVLFNAVPKVIKENIRDKYYMETKLVMSGYHRRHIAEVTIRNFKPYV
jgi:hypothetical protein